MITQEKKSTILAQFRGGETVGSLSREHEVSRQTIYYWLDEVSRSKNIENSLVNYHKNKK